MTTYMSPGVYIREVPSGPQPIAAVSASTLAIIGSTARGPVLDPQRVTGWGEFIDRFGGPVEGSFTAEGISGFFENGGQAAYVVRADPSTASRWMVQDTDGNDIFEVSASSPGAWSNDMTVTVASSTNGGLARVWVGEIVDKAGSTVTVTSASGLRVGNELRNDLAGRTIEEIDGDTLTMDQDVEGLASWAIGTQLFVAQNGTTIDFSTISGLDVGDLIRVEVPGEAVAHTAITALEVLPGGGGRATVTPAVDVPAGAVATRIAVTLFSEDVVLPASSAGDQLAALAARYGFVPAGGVLTLTPSGAGDAVNVVKNGMVFENQDGGAPDTELEVEFNRVDFNPDGGSVLLVTATAAPLEGDDLDFDGANEITEVLALGSDRYQVTVDGTVAAGVARTGETQAFQLTRVVPERFSLTVDDNGIVETFDNLTLAAGHSRHYSRDGVINDASALITVGERLTADVLTNSNIPTQVEALATGTSGLASANDLIAGIASLEGETEHAMVICPDALTLEGTALQGAVIGAMTSHAERFRKFAIVDTPREANDQDLVDWRLETVNSIYAAAYGPHVQILNLDGDAAERFQWVPPSGHVAGVFARTDSERGVHKAPANERMRGIVGLDQDYTQRRQDLLNPNGVNLIRSFPGRGRRIWGARNATTDTTWRYVNVRRLFNVVETSIERGTQWVVFEPNTASTWLRVRVSVENFLNGLWTAGALAGNSPDEAYRVRVGLGETMTEAQVELGLVIVQVAIAAARPAEFVVFEFSHKRLAE